MSIDCSTPSYALQRHVSLVFLAFYGAGLPLGFALLGLLVRHACGPRAERETFAFLMAGYRPPYRYWEALHMCLKTGVIVAVTVPEAPRMRICGAIFVLAAFLLLVQVPTAPVWASCCPSTSPRAPLTRALLEGEGGHRGSPRAVAERSRGM